MKATLKMTDALIRPEELKSNFGKAVILDASWVFDTGSGSIDVREAYRCAHIPGSLFFDSAALADCSKIYDPAVKSLALPLPGAACAALAAQGITQDRPVVIVDGDGGCRTASWARYILLADGFANVKILNGGLPDWKRKFPEALTADNPVFIDILSLPADFVPETAYRDPSIYASRDEVLTVAESCATTLIDTRFTTDNAAILPPSYAGVTVPAHLRIPFQDVVKEVMFWEEFRSREELKLVFSAAALGDDQPAITHCFFGLGATNVATAMEIAGLPRPKIYAGGVVEFRAFQP